MEANTTVETGMPTIETFEDATNVLINFGNNLMETRHKEKPYHNPEHPKTVHVRAMAIADVFVMSSEQRALAAVGSAGHDGILEFDPASGVLGTIRRHRGFSEEDQPSGTEGNEAQSAREMAEEARRINREAGRNIISESQIGTVNNIIGGTYPGVELGPDFKGAPFKNYPYYQQIIKQNPGVEVIIEELEKRGITKGPLFFQPHIEKLLEQGDRVLPEVLAVGLADLGAAGMADAEEFSREGNAEYRELHTNIDDKIDPQYHETVKDDMGKWLRNQIGFATWQMLRFEKIVYLLRENGQLDERQEQGLRGLFSHFKENIEASIKRADDFKEAPFEHLAKEMGYAIAA